MQSTLRIIGVILGFFFTIFLHFAVINILPHPSSLINITLLASVWTIFLYGPRFAVWLTIGFGFILELWSVAPFGAILISYFASILLLNWFLFNVFTNRSLYIVFFASIFAIAMGKFFYALVILTASVFSPALIKINAEYFFSSLWSIFLTSILLLVWYALSSLFIRRLRVEYIHSERAFL